MQREQMALDIVQTQRESSSKGSMQTHNEPNLRERHLALRESHSFRESKRPHKFSIYVVLMSKIIDSKPSTFEEDTKQ